MAVINASQVITLYKSPASEGERFALYELRNVTTGDTFDCGVTLQDFSAVNIARAFFPEGTNFGTAYTVPISVTNLTIGQAGLTGEVVLVLVQGSAHV